MKHLSNLITLLIVATSLPCHAMEGILNASQAKIISTLTTVKSPRSVICFPNDQAVILGKNSCRLCDFSTNKEIAKISKYLYETPCQSIVKHPHKNLLALSHHNDLTIYDITTKTQIWKITAQYFTGMPAFNPNDDTILIGTDIINITSYNYKTNEQKSYRSPMGLLVAHIQVSSHPIQQKLVACTRDECSILQFDNDSLIKKMVLTETNYIGDCKYSPDESLIAINNCLHGCSIYDLQSNTNINLDDQKTCAIVFHPTSFILATLSYQHNAIYYWNTKNKQFITTTLLNENFCLGCILTECMDFSCDGTKLIVTLADECLVLEVPFEVLHNRVYQLGTKEKSIFAFWILKNHLHNNTNAFPCDITYLLIKYLLAASKY